MWSRSALDWCEPNQEAGVLEPHNTWTNFAYLVSACALQAFASERGKSFVCPKSGPAKNISNEEDALGLGASSRLVWCMFVFSVALTGVASAWFHATLYYVAQKCDEFFESAAVICLLHMHTQLSPASQAKCAVLHSLVLGVSILAVPSVFCEVHLGFACLLAAALARQRLNRLRSRVGLAEEHLEQLEALQARAVLAVVLALVGFAAWLLDHCACSLTGWLHLHAYAWHPLTAWAMFVAGKSSMALDTTHKSVIQSSLTEHSKST
eukprot:6181371-Pleurochrysis_carterae.AAC.2